jgi:tetratricopeptide (TPR) repeat protein
LSSLRFLNSLRALASIRAAAVTLTLLAAGQTRGAEPTTDATATTPPPTPPATTPSSSTGTGVDAEIDEHVAQGHRLYQLGRYQEAIAEYRRAYELRADSSFLFQIAESYRQLGAIEQALFYYDRFLAGAIEGPDRDAAEERVSELERLRARPAIAAPAQGLGVAGGTEAGAKQPTPLWRRWWVWTAVGAVLAAGVTAAALAGRSDSSIPTTDLGNKKFF